LWYIVVTKKSDEDGEQVDCPTISEGLYETAGRGLEFYLFCFPIEKSDRLEDLWGVVDLATRCKHIQVFIIQDGTHIHQAQ